jgi:quercetin dioxygenase-like cupin family protein
MIEQVFHLARGDAKTIEKVVMDENLHYMHMILNQGEALPEHFSNSNVYMAVLRGTLSIGLGDQETHVYPTGSLLKIPFNTRMNVGNRDGEVLEITVVKAPAPRMG